MIWYKLEKKSPIATQSGCWDGLRTDKILLCTRGGNLHVAVMYEGILDGSKFRNFYDDRDFEINDVIYWAEVDSPL
jgi:hypothetical protein